MEYFNSFEFWVYLVWISAAVGLGLCIGVYTFYILTSIFDSLSKLKFKKDKYGNSGRIARKINEFKK